MAAAAAGTAAAPAVAVVVGAGPGLGLSSAKRFAQGGYHVALMARNRAHLEASTEEVRKAAASSNISSGSSSGGTVAECATGIECDATDPASVAAAFDAAKKIGTVEVMIYNASAGFPWPPPKFTETTLDSFKKGLDTSCVGAFLCAQQAVPCMLAAGKGTIIFTGATASLRGGAGMSAFAPGKFALRALAQSMARELHPQNIHVAHVIIDGIIRTPRTVKMVGDMPAEKQLHPDAIANCYWMLHSQDRSTWTQELDLRPFVEKF